MNKVEMAKKLWEMYNDPNCTQADMERFLQANNFQPHTINVSVENRQSRRKQRATDKQFLRRFKKQWGV